MDGSVLAFGLALAVGGAIGILQRRRSMAVEAAINATPVKSVWRGLPLPVAVSDAIEERDEACGTSNIAFPLVELSMPIVEKWFQTHWPPTDYMMRQSVRSPKKIQYVLVPTGHDIDGGNSCVVLGLYHVPQSPLFPYSSIHVVITDDRRILTADYSYDATSAQD